MVSFRVTKYVITESHVSVPASADRLQLVSVISRRIAAMESKTQVLRDELKHVQEHYNDLR
jgi:hypothetical protein